MIRRAWIGFVCLASIAAAPARAHFIWIDLAQAPGAALQAQLFFSEQPAPGEPHLIAKIAHAKAWLRTAEQITELSLARSPDENSAALVGPCAPSAAASLEAICDYGVYARGPSGVLLQYYAKRLAGDWSKQAAKLARAEKLALDIVPSLAGDQLNLLVLYQGKPSGGGELTMIDPSGKAHEIKTDAAGGGTFNAASPGRYAVRAAHIEADRSGARDGKKYAQTWHYATLVLDVRPGETTATVADEDTALRALERARDGRAMWTDFPGFTADLAISSGGQQVAAKVSIDADGTVELDMPKSPLALWVEEQLNSLVQHRMPSGEVTQGVVTYADRDLAHPLGRKIDLGDPSLQSAYRLKDDVIMEVNRSMGKLRFTISVLEIARNPENKYLPRSFAMNFFDAESGDLKTSLAYWNDWQRVGRFDLPKAIIEVSAGQGGAGTRQIVFANCHLVEPK